MKTLFVSINLAIYLLLFISLFIKVTDDSSKKTFERISMIILMLWSFFCFSIFAKMLFLNKSLIKYLDLNIYETFTNFLFLIYILCKIKDDRIFKIKRK